MKKIILLLLGITCLTACSTTYTVSLQREYEEQFLGKSHNYIVTAWGAPNRTESDGNGGQILIYEKSSALSQEVATNIDIFNGTYTPGTYTTTNTAYAHFYVDHRGNCYLVKTNHTQKRVDYAKQARNGKIFLISFGIPVVLLIISALTGNLG